jgi:F-box protein 21
MLEECISKLNEQKAEIAAAVRLYLECANISLSLLFCLLQKTVHHRPSSLKFSVGLVVIRNYTKWGRNFRKPCVIVSWNVKFQESNEWKSKVTSHYYNEEDSDDEEVDEGEEDSDNEEVDEGEEDLDDEEVDEDKVCSRTKKVIPSQQPHYHILMVDSDEDNSQFQLNVPEGN